MSSAMIAMTTSSSMRVKARWTRVWRQPDIDCLPCEGGQNRGENRPGELQSTRYGCHRKVKSLAVMRRWGRRPVGFRRPARETGVGRRGFPAGENERNPARAGFGKIGEALGLVAGAAARGAGRAIPVRACRPVGPAAHVLHLLDGERLGVAVER